MRPLVTALASAPNPGWHQAYLAAIDQVSVARSAEIYDHAQFRGLPLAAVGFFTRITSSLGATSFGFQTALTKDLLLQEQAESMALCYTIEGLEDAAVTESLRNTLQGGRPSSIQWTIWVGDVDDFALKYTGALDQIVSGLPSSLTLSSSSASDEAIANNLPSTIAEAKSGQQPRPTLYKMGRP